MAGTGATAIDAPEENSRQCDANEEHPDRHGNDQALSRVTHELGPFEVTADSHLRTAETIPPARPARVTIPHNNCGAESPTCVARVAHVLIEDAEADRPAFGREAIDLRGTSPLKTVLFHDGKQDRKEQA